MLEVWTEDDKRPVTSVDQDTARLALNIITCAGFGLAYSFRAAADNLKEGYSMSYGASLMAVMENISFLILVPSWVLDLPVLPEGLANFKRAIHEFKGYMVDMVNTAKQEAVNGDTLQPNLLNTLVQKSEMGNASKGSGGGLTDEEIHGNLFIFSFAGHETTANTLTYSIYLLAAFPKWQDWLFQEIKSVCWKLDEEEPNLYESLYPKLNRCLAVMVSPITP